MKDILNRIAKLQDERGWSEYALAERAELPQSTISSWYSKNAKPTFSSLQKICNAFGITLTQLLAEDGEMVTLTPSQKKLLDVWSRLSPEQQKAVFSLIENM